EHAQMDTLRSVCIDTAHKVLIYLFCHERDHRGRRLGDGHESCVQRHICVDLILLHSLCPETLAASSDIPVAHVVNEFLQCARRLRNPVICQIAVHVFHHCVHLGEEPLIHNREL